MQKMVWDRERDRQGAILVILSLRTGSRFLLVKTRGCDMRG